MLREETECARNVQKRVQRRERACSVLGGGVGRGMFRKEGRGQGEKVSLSLKHLTLIMRVT